MGKGDKKSRRGKIVAGSYGVRRNKNKRKKSKRTNSSRFVASPDAIIVKEVQPVVELKTIDDAVLETDIKADEKAVEVIAVEENSKTIEEPETVPPKKKAAARSKVKTTD